MISFNTKIILQKYFRFTKTNEMKFILNWTIIFTKNTCNHFNGAKYNKLQTKYDRCK